LRSIYGRIRFGWTVLEVRTQNESRKKKKREELLTNCNNGVLLLRNDRQKTYKGNWSRLWKHNRFRKQTQQPLIAKRQSKTESFWNKTIELFRWMHSQNANFRHKSFPLGRFPSRFLIFLELNEMSEKERLV
jgi:hypothetical protein